MSMKTIVFPAAQRGTGDYGWLKTNYYFSFAQYHDRDKMHFGVLRVLNDDFIAGGGSFPTHPHDNMEIITIPFNGALKHKDSTGGQGIISAGDVQIMSAGTGVQHSEANASATDAVTLFQIWIFPKLRNISPRYEQASFNTSDRINKWQTVVSPIENEKALWINQDARLSLTKLESGKTLVYSNAFKGNGVFLVTITGAVVVDKIQLSQRDALGIYDTDEFSITAAKDAELLAIEIPMQ